MIVSFTETALALQSSGKNGADPEGSPQIYSGLLGETGGETGTDHVFCEVF